MRQFCRAVVIGTFVVLLTVALGAVPTLALAATLAVTALIVPGTSTPNAEVPVGYIDNVENYYLTHTPCTVNCTAHGVPYPASLWPLVNTTAKGGSFDKYGVSVDKGVAQLNAQIIQTLTSTTGPIVIFGFSQGSNVVSNELATLALLDPTTKARLSVVLTGNTNRPNGGVWTRLGMFGNIPILGIPLGNPTPNDVGIPTTDIAFEYDPVGDAPAYPLHLLADANAVLGLVYIHTSYLQPFDNPTNPRYPDGYTPDELAKQLDPTLHPENFQHYGDPVTGTTYVLIPTQTLPIVQPVLGIAAKTHTSAIVVPLVDLVSPVLRVMIDTGYDRTTNPGVYTTFKLGHFVNPVTYTADLVNAAKEGVEAFRNDIGGSSVLSVPPSSASTFAIPRQVSIPPVQIIANAARPLGKLPIRANTQLNRFIGQEPAQRTVFAASAVHSRLETKPNERINAAFARAQKQIDANIKNATDKLNSLAANGHEQIKNLAEAARNG